MKSNIDYFYLSISADSLEVDDIGNCFIEANNDNAEVWYLGIRTCMGIARIAEYGPYLDGLVSTNISCTFLQLDYNEQKLEKIITKFLNNPARAITQALLIDEDEFKNIMEKLKNPMEYLYD